MLAPLPSGVSIAKIKSGAGNTYASTSRTVGAPRPTPEGTAQLNIYTAVTCLISIVIDTGRATADHGEARRTGGCACYCVLCYGIQGAMSVAGPLPPPTIAGAWERRRGAGRRIGRNTNRRWLLAKGNGFILVWESLTGSISDLSRLLRSCVVEGSPLNHGG